MNNSNKRSSEVRRMLVARADKKRSNRALAKELEVTEGTIRRDRDCRCVWVGNDVYMTEPPHYLPCCSKRSSEGSERTEWCEIRARHLGRARGHWSTKSQT
jgi:hypothetical protein